MTGLLSQEHGESDYNIALLIANSVAADWNRNRPEYGIHLRASRAAVQRMCDRGAALFSSGAFPEKPGPYKRVAAFVVLATLYPIFMPLFKFPASPQDKKNWDARFVHQCIAPCMRSLVVELDGKTEPMPPWRAFPSLHYRLEFLGWLRWLSAGTEVSPQIGTPSAEWQQFQNDRLARMVMAASLMIEACHYVPNEDQTGDSIRGRITSCLKNPDEELRLDLYFDAY